MSSKHALSRRRFLRGVGGVAVGLPLLSSLPLRSEEGVPPTSYPKRFIFMIHPNGVIQEDFWPEAGNDERDFTLSPVLEPLAPYRDQLIVIKGLDQKSSGSGPGEPHQTGMGGILTGRPLLEGNFRGNDGTLAGWGSGISIDQYIAGAVGQSTPRKSLELGARADVQIGSDVSSRISYAAEAQPLPPQNDPTLVFDDIFTMGGGSGDAARLLRDQRVSVLDTVHEQFKLLEKRIGADDRQRLDQHFTMVRDLEQRLRNENVTGNACNPPVRPEEQEPDSEETMALISKLQIDLMVTAMACDITRVATLQISNSRNHIRYPWINSLGDGHGLSHIGYASPDARSQWNARDRWHAGLVAYMCDKLSNIREGDGTMLDNTIIWWTSEIAQGTSHTQRNMPTVLLGSAGGFFDTGRYLQLSNASHNDLLITLARAFDVPTPVFGSPQFCNDGLPILRKTT